MVDIIHRIGIEASRTDVYDAITSVAGISGWWTRDTTGDAGAGGAFRVTFRKGEDVIGEMALEVLEANAERGVRWRVVEGPPEWIDTAVTFDLSQQDGYTVLLFGHRNWREAGEFTAHCSMKWATFLLSLRDLVERGAGRPAPEDLKIDDWN